MEYSYCVVESTYRLDDKSYTAYGIACVTSEDDSIIVLATYDDLSTDLAKVSHLVKLCNELKLDIIHLPDVVDDFIA